MGYSLLEFMKKIGIFIVCAQSLMHFSAGKVYEKYVKLLIGIMILAQFLVPVRALFLGVENAQMWEQIADFQTELESISEGAELSLEENEEPTQQLEEEIKEKLAEAAAEYGCSVTRAEVSEDPPCVLVEIESIESTEEGIREIKVEKVEISGQETAEEDEEEYGELKHRFGMALGIDEAYVKVRSE